MELEELLIRQLANQHLLRPVSYLNAAQDLCGMQAQFLSNACHALRIRSGDFGEGQTRGLVKSWTNRGTMHVFAESDLPLFLYEGRSRFLRPCDTLEADEFITKKRKQYFADLIVDRIAAGIDTREALKEACSDRGMTETEAESVFNAWGGTIRALCETGRICHKVQEKKAFCICPPFVPMEEAAAKLELSRRYFTNYGPATIKDAAYFFGTTQTQIRKYLNELPVKTEDCNGKTYYYIENGQSYNQEIPKCLFLAGFDPLLLGYQKTESLYLPSEHLRKIFTLSGIVKPSILLDGRIAGSWKRKGAKAEITLFESISADEKKWIEEKANLLWPELKSIVFTEN